MFGLELMSVGLLQLASYQVECKLPKPPVINVVPSESKVSYDTTRSRKYLKSFDIDTVSPYGPGVETVVNGLMSGEIAIEHRIGLANEVYKGLNKTCIYIDSIDVKVRIDPTIYIAKEIKKDSCEYKSVLKHEKKHIKVDEIIVNRLAKRIGMALYNDIVENGAAFGPYRRREVQDASEEIGNRITKILEEQTAIMNMERKMSQQLVDSLEEYERVRKECEKEGK